MSEKFPTNTAEAYDEEGHVVDPEVAREMARAEAPFHEKVLGFFKPSKKTQQEGERAAEGKLGEILEENSYDEEADKKIETLIPRFKEMQKDVWADSPDYANLRQGKWSRLEEWIQNKSLLMSRREVLNRLEREIEMHEKYLQDKAIDGLVKSLPQDVKWE